MHAEREEPVHDTILCDKLKCPDDSFDRCDKCFGEFCEKCLLAHCCIGESSSSSSSSATTTSSSSSVVSSISTSAASVAQTVPVSKAPTNAVFQQTKRNKIARLVAKSKKFTYEANDNRVEPKRFPLFNEAKTANRVQSWVWDHFKSINVKKESNGDEKIWGRDHKACNIVTCSAC